jgi:anti-sigma factor RsiW
MSCERYEEPIALHVEGDLSPAESADVEAHLAGCAACAAFAGELRESQRALKALGQEDVDPAALAAVRRRVGQALGDRGAARPARRPAALWALAAAAGVAVVAFVLQRPADGPPPQPPSPSAAAPPVVTPPAGPAIPSPAVVASAPGGPAPAATSRPARRATTVSEEVPGPTVARNGDSESPLVIKLVTNDPDIVIYWLVEQNGGKS